jgi:hypothetical protein
VAKQSVKAGHFGGNENLLSDSPYQTNEPVLSPGGGMVAGVTGSLLMLVVISLLRPFSGLSAVDLLIRLGQPVIPHVVAPRSEAFVFANGILFACIGAGFGVLYAVSQDRIPVSGLMAVGLFYGIVIWVVSRVLTPLLLGSSLRPALHSYPWFLACLVYGLCLALFAIWVDSRRPKSAAATPID